MLKERLVELRKETKLRQEDFAGKIGIARTTYAMYEQGRRQPDYEILQRIASFYDVTIDYLLGGSDTPSLTQKEDIQSDLDYKEWLESIEHLPEDEKKEAKKELKQYADYLIKTKFNKN